MAEFEIARSSVEEFVEDGERCDDCVGRGARVVRPYIDGSGGIPAHLIGALIDAVGSAFLGAANAHSGTIEGRVAKALVDTDGGTVGIATYSGVRRLTVTEAERLQGFADGYTAVPFRGKPAADGNRYRAIGNSMAVPVIRWIGEQIVAAGTANGLLVKPDRPRARARRSSRRSPEGS